MQFLKVQLTFTTQPFFFAIYMNISCVKSLEVKCIQEAVNANTLQEVIHTNEHVMNKKKRFTL